MQACTSTSKLKQKTLAIAGLTLIAALTMVLGGASSSAWAASGEIREVPNPAAGDDDEFNDTPYTEYGEFNEEEEETEAATFFQYGRFFGVSLGAGFEGVTGNRGLLYRGGFPTISIKAHYWFDFDFALSMGFVSTSHSYEDANSSNRVTTVRILQFGLDLYWYIPNRNLPAAFTFAHPYLLLSGGSFGKSDTNESGTSTTSDNEFGFGLGAGLEFLISPKKTYFQLEGRMYFVGYEDQFSSRFNTSAAGNIPDLTGNFYTITGSVLFTW